MVTKFSNFFKSLKPQRKKHQTERVPKPLSEQECQVCLETGQCISTRKCTHPICITCLGTYIHLTHNSRMPCPCPSSAVCKQLFTIDDISPYVNNEQIGKIWLVQAGIQIERGQGMYCPNTKCSKPILWKAKAARRTAAAGKCRACHQPICMVCKCVYHTNLTCSQYRGLPEEERNVLDLQFLALAQENRWKRCPGCQVMVQRETGCFYMVCSCGTRFCYECGVKLTSHSHTCWDNQVLGHAQIA